jgi:hypothetical protein
MKGRTKKPVSKETEEEQQRRPIRKVTKQAEAQRKQYHQCRKLPRHPL